VDDVDPVDEVDIMDGSASDGGWESAVAGAVE
jgi:hypothetical protein